MIKAEDLSRQYVLPFLDKQYEKYGEHKQMELSRFDGYDMMSAYEEGYHQAEKDLEIVREEVIDWVDNHWREYVNVDADGVVCFGHWKNDLRKTMEDE